ncbi:MAG: MoxR family ATPase [Mastigocoleus sp. MO_167.B18]|nr:MoxR family ATPase [Mastigocoleus sp. MO_167.B18]
MTNNNQTENWKIFHGNGEIKKDWKLPEPPNWRPFGKDKNTGKTRREIRGETFQAREEEIKMVNAALYLRRPLLVTGKPGTGKSSLAYAVARELDLGEVLYWPITTRTTLKDGLYNYDAIARLQRLQEVKELQQENSSPMSSQEREEKLKQQLKTVEKYITLGPLGTALLPSEKPRVLLIDEVDKSDIDLPNDLLTIFEEGRFKIPELVRIKEEVPTATVRTAYSADTNTTDTDTTDTKTSAEINEGIVTCTTFPFVILTSNGERDFPPPFLRRCLRLTMKEPEKKDLVRIIAAHLGEEMKDPEDSNKLNQQALDRLVNNFIKSRETQTLANDQLLNALFMVAKGRVSTEDKLIERLLQDLGQVEEDE